MSIVEPPSSRALAPDAPEAFELTLARVAQQYGTPCFVYFMDRVQARVRAIREAFSGAFQISYAMKCNPHPEILRKMLGWVDALDISSGGELATAMGVGWPSETISFTGPAKQTSDLEAAVRHAVGEVVIESVREAEQLARAARAAGTRQRVLVRIAPARVPKGFGVNMAGRPCQFGIDEEDLAATLPKILALPELELIGFHIYSGTQCLKPDAIAENYAIFLDLFRRTSIEHDIVPSKLIFGSGIGIPYHDGDASVDLEPIAQRILPELLAFKAEPRFANASLVLETGRFLIGEAGFYLTRVVNRKHSRGSEIATLDGGMHHHLGAAGHLGMALHRNYRLSKIYSERSGPLQKYDLYGPLCTTIDVLGRGVTLPGLEIGDVICIHSSGAYAVTASPINFISHPLPGELMVESESGTLRITDIGRVRERPNAGVKNRPSNRQLDRSRIEEV